MRAEGSASRAPTANRSFCSDSMSRRHVIVHAGRSRGAQTGVQLVDLAVRIDPRVGLRHARVVEERRLAGVAGLCVDLHPSPLARDDSECSRRVTRGIIGADVRRFPAAAQARQRFRRTLLGWYRRNGRDLPWRRHQRPVSHPRLRGDAAADAGRSRAAEVSRVAATSIRRSRRSPPRAEDDVAETWRPLGYNIRPQAAACDRARVGRALRRRSCRPIDETLLSFKGIGAYTAGAIRSFAFRERAAILDTNVARVLFRVFVGRGDPKSARDEQASVGGVEAIVPHKHVFDFNQALMDLGATVCVARKPKCGECPMTSLCSSYPMA